MNKSLVAVWPLVRGTSGVNSQTDKSVKLEPFCKGFMYSDAAEKAEAAGKVQIMVGLRPEDLKQKGEVVEAPVVEEPEVDAPTPPPAPKKKKSKAKGEQLENPVLWP